MRNAYTITRALLDNSEMERLRNAHVFVTTVYDEMDHEFEMTKIVISQDACDSDPRRFVMIAGHSQVNDSVWVVNARTCKWRECWIPGWLQDEIKKQLMIELRDDTEQEAPPLEPIYSNQCYNCQTKNVAWACGRCGIAEYCDQNCQRADWTKKHSSECC